MTAAQMRGLAAVARDFGDGDIRLTVWQNFLISGVPTERVAAAAGRDRGARPHHQGEFDPLRASSPAPAMSAASSRPPTPSVTRRRSRRGARHGWRSTSPVNIHLTGCHHSCAQHFISEIGLLACKVQETEDGDAVEGYHILVGGGFGPHAALGRDVYRDVKARGRPEEGRAHPQGLYGPPRLAAGKLPRLREAP